MLRRGLVAGGAGAAAAALLLVAAPGASAAPADAGSGGSATGGGYAVTATVTFSGDAAPAGGGSVSRSVPARCWWEAVEGAPVGDPDAAIAWFTERGLDMEGTFAIGRVTFGTADDWRSVAERQAAGEDLTYYVARCRQGVEQGELGAFSGRTYEGGPQYGTVAVTYAAFPTGAAPEPEIDPEDLARLARDEMVVPAPDVERNPRSSDGLDATFVGLPTWFWVTDPDAVGGATGTRTIRADVGDVWAEVTATTGGLTVSSPAGAVTCDPGRAQRAWSPGSADEAGCTVAFERASVGHASGYRVDLSTTWTATWTSGDGSGGDLEGLTRGAETFVPVAESQSLVRPGR